MFLLHPFSLIYRGAVALRNTLYDREVLKCKKLPVPVISVGNLSVGGTGKTSLVRHLTEKLGDEFKVAVLLRGYKRKSRGSLVVSQWGELKVDLPRSGDEAFLLARMLPQASVVVSESRFEGGMLAVEELKAELIILDDGFQHRGLCRDLDIVLLRKRDIKDKLLPAGLLREPVSSLSRAEAIVLSYQEIEPFDFKFGDKPIFKMFRRFTHLLNTKFERIPLDTLKDREVIAFAGLGSNEQFFEVLQRLGIKVKKRLSFPDHHHYEDFKLEEGEVYITTPKDMIKFPPSENLFALDFEIEVEGLLDFVKAKLYE